MIEPPLPDKDVVIIVSAGRTGTQFFGERLGRCIEGAYSVHEPDVLAGFEYPVWRRIRDFGFYHVVIGKLLRRTGVRNLSLRHLAGELGIDDLIDEVIRHRAAYYARVPGRLVIEAYTGWFGILPAIPRAFPRHRVAAIVRDPREWVRSIMNWGTLYGPRDWVGKLGLGRLTPAVTGDREAAARWRRMRRFERVCWAWGAINGAMADGIEQLEHGELFRYEDMFLDPQGEAMEAFMRHITEWDDHRYAYALDSDVVRGRLHASEDRFPAWREWSPAQARCLERHCAALMQRFGYGGEPEWAALLGRGGEDA